MLSLQKKFFFKLNGQVIYLGNIKLTFSIIKAKQFKKWCENRVGKQYVLEMFPLSVQKKKLVYTIFYLTPGVTYYNLKWNNVNHWKLELSWLDILSSDIVDLNCEVKYVLAEVYLSFWSTDKIIDPILSFYFIRTFT